LLEALSPLQRQVIEGLYLRTPEVSRTDLRRELKLTPQQLKDIEREALGRLREG
jgi:DNA-directed RNA polymerase sigma subunit (sigma70/sigma32)